MNPSLSAACAALLGLLVAISPARAAGGGVAENHCQNNPEACEAAAKKLKARCSADPQACERAHERFEDAKARCAADPQACEEKKQQLRERGQKLRERCAADPEACQHKKQQLRERLRQRRDGGISPAGETPPIIPPKPAQ